MAGSVVSLGLEFAPDEALQSLFLLVAVVISMHLLLSLG
jgi:hypothetical protein